MTNINYIATLNVTIYTPIKEYYFGNFYHHKIAVVEDLLACYDSTHFIELNNASKQFFDNNFYAYKRYYYKLHKFD
jgi:hypothetical protein